MRVSIIVTVHNKWAYVAQAIGSALGQTYTNKELIVVDDGSTDGSINEVEKAIEKSRGNQQITLLRQDNMGVAASRNRGIALAGGDLILPLDGDDWISGTYLEKTVPLFWPRPQIGIVATDMQRFGRQHDLIRAERRVLAEQLESNMLPVTSLIRKEAVTRVGGYFSGIDGWEDWELWIRLLKFGWQVDVVNEPLFHYRVLPDGLNAAAADKHQQLLDRMRHFHPDFRGR